MFNKCDEPLKLKYIQMVVLPTTNIKGYPEFEVGKDHYFIGEEIKILKLYNATPKCMTTLLAYFQHKHSAAKCKHSSMHELQDLSNFVQV
jgi:hypothetical protein